MPHYNRIYMSRIDGDRSALVCQAFTPDGRLLPARLVAVNPFDRHENLNSWMRFNDIEFDELANDEAWGPYFNGYMGGLGATPWDPSNGLGDYIHLRDQLGLLNKINAPYQRYYRRMFRRRGGW